MSTKWSYDPNYILTSPYGMRMHPVYKVPKFHRGIDLVVSRSNGPLYAFVAGEVVHAKMGVTGSGFGNYGIVVAIKDKNGFLHCYAHMSATSVTVGQIVEKDDLIGYQGNTGVSSGPHLHYEIRKTYEPSFGYTATETGVVEPTQYLINYYLNESKKQDTKVVFNDKLIGYGKVIDGHVYLPLRTMGESLGKTVVWDNEKKIAYLDGKSVADYKIIDNQTYIGVRTASEMLGATVSWNGEVKKVFIYK